MRYLSRLISLLVMGTVALTPVKSQAQTPNPTSPEGDPLELSGEALDPLTRQALDQFNQGQTTEALATLQQALDTYQGAGNWLQVAVTWNNVGLVQEQLENSDEAIAAYQQAIDAYDRVTDTAVAKRGQAKTLNNLGGVYVNLQQPEAALGFLERALVLLREVEAQDQAAITLRNLGGLYALMGRFADGIQALQQSLTLEEDLGNITAQIVTRERLGSLYAQGGALTEAQRVLQGALDLTPQLPQQNQDIAAILLSQLAEVQELAGDMGGAIAAYQESLDRLDRSTSNNPNLKQGRLELLVRLGGLEGDRGNWDQAIHQYQTALAQLDSTNDPLTWGEVMTYLAGAYSNQQKWAEAESAYQETLAIIAPLNVPLAQAQLLRGLATVYQAQEQTTQAEDYLNQALALQSSLQNSTEVDPKIQQQEQGLTLNLLGDIYRQQYPEDPQALNRAMAQYQQALSTFEAAQDVFGQGQTLVDVGLTQLLQNQPDAAISPLLSAVQLWQTVSYRTGTLIPEGLEAHQLLQAALIRTNQPELALMSAEDERSFPTRLYQFWQGQVQVNPPDPLSLDQMKALVAEHNKPLLFYDLAMEPGGNIRENLPKLRIWIVQPSGDISLRDVDLSSLGMTDPARLASLVDRVKDLGDSPSPSALGDLEQLSNLLVAPITLDLVGLGSSNLQLVIPPLFLSVPFDRLSLPDPNGGPTVTLGDRFQLELFPSILALAPGSN